MLRCRDINKAHGSSMHLADKSDSVNHVLVGGFGQHLNDASVCWVHSYKRFLLASWKSSNVKAGKTVHPTNA